MEYYVQPGKRDVCQWANMWGTFENESKCPTCGEIITSAGCGCNRNNNYRLAAQGWICPVCGRGNSPWSMVCPCQNEPYKFIW